MIDYDIPKFSATHIEVVIIKNESNEQFSDSGFKFHLDPRIEFNGHLYHVMLMEHHPECHCNDSSYQTYNENYSANENYSENIEYNLPLWAVESEKLVERVKRLDLNLEDIHYYIRLIKTDKEHSEMYLNGISNIVSDCQHQIGVESMY